MNPALVRELDRVGAALVQRVRALPTGDRRDLAGSIDAKDAVATDLAALFKRWREAAAGTVAQRPSDLFIGPVKVARQRPRHVVVMSAR